MIRPWVSKTLKGVAIALYVGIIIIFIAFLQTLEARVTKMESRAMQLVEVPVIVEPTVIPTATPSATPVRTFKVVSPTVAK